ncbi:DNA polymerase IV [Nakamurella silvestris]|nr:DNA polymerase IV [Nakamurella silvestris]
MAGGPLLHADADAFFASVALRTRPELADRPVAVVAHVFVASAGYAARAYGIHGGMLVQEALRLCPDLVLLDVPHEEVEQVGDALFDLFHEFTDAVEPGSIEEAFLDVSPTSWEDAVDSARELRRRAAAELSIPVSVGVGRTKLMAKLASRAAKPDGLHVIGPAEEAALRSSLPIADVWGIGSRTSRRLLSLGVIRLLDLDGIDQVELEQHCGVTMARRLGRIRLGTDDATVNPLRHRDSFTAESSTAGYHRPDRPPVELLELCLRRVCHRAQRVGLAGSRLTVHLKPFDGSRPTTLDATVAEATGHAELWWPVVRALLERHDAPRLTGLAVTLGGLVPADQVQAALF